MLGLYKVISYANKMCFCLIRVSLDADIAFVPQVPPDHLY
jgi:hypothetical protein